MNAGIERARNAGRQELAVYGVLSRSVYWYPFTPWSGTGPFFGEPMYFANKRLAENMDLSPSRS